MEAPQRDANTEGVLMGPEGGFIIGSEFLMTAGAIASYWYGDVAEVRTQAEGVTDNLASALRGV